MKFKVEGRVYAVGETKSFGANGFTKRQVVLETSAPNAQYRDFAAFEFIKDKCAAWDGVKPGTRVEVEFFLEAREWNGQWFGGCRGWAFRVLDEAAAASAEQPSADAPEAAEDVPTMDGLPF